MEAAVDAALLRDGSVVVTVTPPAHPAPQFSAFVHAPAAPAAAAAAAGWAGADPTVPAAVGAHSTAAPDADNPRPPVGTPASVVAHLAAGLRLATRPGAGATPAAAAQVAPVHPPDAPAGASGAPADASGVWWAPGGPPPPHAPMRPERRAETAPNAAAAAAAVVVATANAPPPPPHAPSDIVLCLDVSGSMSQARCARAT